MSTISPVDPTMSISAVVQRVETSISACEKTIGSIQSLIAGRDLSMAKVESKMNHQMELEDAPIREIPIASSGIPSDLSYLREASWFPAKELIEPDTIPDLHYLIESVEGNVPTLQDAELIIIKDYNHDDDVHQIAHSIFIDAIFQKGTVFLREGNTCLEPVPSEYSMIFDPHKREEMEELGWDDMRLHQFCDQYDTRQDEILAITEDLIELRTENLSLLEKDTLTDEEIERMNELEEEIASKENEVEELDAASVPLKASRDWALLDGRNISLLKAIEACQGKRRILKAGSRHFSPDVLDKLSREKVIIVSFKTFED